MSDTPNKINRELAQQFPLRLLLVDDNLINVKIGTEMLRRMGYQTQTANSGTAALQALEKESFDLVFMDVQMPELDGYETTRKIRSAPPKEKQPIIIAVTGSAMEGDREKCLEAGMNDYILKPIRVESVQAALMQWGSKINSSENPSD